MKRERKGDTIKLIQFWGVGEDHSVGTEFGVVHIEKVDDHNVIFRASDITNILGYSVARRAVSKSVKDEDKRICSRNYTGRSRNYTFVNLTGARALIAACKRDIAARISRWLETVVLPSIFDKRVGRPKTPLNTQVAHVEKVKKIFISYHARKRILEDKLSKTNPKWVVDSLETLALEHKSVEAVYRVEKSKLREMRRKDRYAKLKRRRELREKPNVRLEAQVDDDEAQADDDYNRSRLEDEKLVETNKQIDMLRGKLAKIDTLLEQRSKEARSGTSGLGEQIVSLELEKERIEEEYERVCSDYRWSAYLK